MRFTIPCKTFSRLAIIPLNFTKDVSDDMREQLSCVRLENRKGKTFAIVANQKIAAIEYICDTQEKDGSAHVVINKDILEVCKNEHDVFEVMSLPDLSIGTLKSMFGYQYVGNACLYRSNVLDEWRSWGPKKSVTKTNGPLFLNMNYIELLNKSSPSGNIVFPDHIDVEQSLVLRDFKNPSWVGLFTPTPPPIDRYKLKPAVLPDWWN